MAVQVKVPPMGESVVEATIARWHKKKGDAVAVGDILVELETDKVNQEVSADRGGILGEILAGEGSSVAPGDLLAVIEESGSSEPASPPARATEPPAAQQDAAPPQAPANGAPAAAETTATADGKATPLALRVAAELQVDISHVVGSGPGGRINREDVEEYARTAGLKEPAPTPPNTVDHEAPPAPAPQAPPAPAHLAPAPVAPQAAAPPVQSARHAAEPASAPAPDRPEVRQRLSRRRLTIARRLVEAQQTAAMLTTFNEVDLTAVMEIRKRRKESFKEQHGVGLGFMSFFCKAAVGALKAFPEINSELQGEELVIKHYYDLGIAVGAKEGLVVPVLRSVDRLSFAQIEQQISDLATRAREGGLSVDDLRGGTFTITNGGIFGSMLSTPILNQPQVAILGMHRIQERPVAVNGEVVIRPMMYLALTYDHRVVDGSGAVQFLVRLRDLLQDPERLLLEG